MKPHFSSEIRVSGVTPRFESEATIYFFDLEPVLSRVGAGLANPDRLRLICERHVRSIAGSDFALFTGSGFYLVVTSCSGLAAQRLAVYVNTSLLMLLFGTESLSPEQSIEMFRPVEADDLPETAHGKLPEMVRPNTQGTRLDANWDPRGADEDGMPNGALATLAREGVHLEQGVELSFFPVHDLRRKSVAALFCAPTFAGAVFGHQAFQQISQSELPYIDRAILEHSLRFARRLADAGIVMAVGAPVSFETLAWSKSRQIYQWALRGAHAADLPQLILKIEDIPPGTPADRIAHVVSNLRPFARHIFVHLPDDRVEFGMTGRMGASGLVLSLPRRATLPEVLAECKYLSRAALAQSAMACIDHVESDESLSVARTAGVRFAVGHVFGSETLRGRSSTDDVGRTLARIESATAKHLSMAS